VNENNSTTGHSMDLSAFSDAQLVRLREEINRELEERQELKRRDALQKVLAAAQEAGMTPEELLRMATEGKGRRRRGGGGKRGAIAWRHPDDPGKVYRGGKKPDWVKELEAAGRKPVKVE
jgi:DNA-binding protein H-NS